MPVAQQAYGFVCAHSPDDETGDLLPGLCLLTELWLSKVGCCRDFGSEIGRQIVDTACWCA